ncbi:MAG: hypothetical protein Q7S03_01595 [bacterium]|nr:hypothetical protein [bacterium]
MSPERNPYTPPELRLKDGTLWIGDESNGFPETKLNGKPKEGKLEESIKEGVEANA